MKLLKEKRAAHPPAMRHQQIHIRPMVISKQFARCLTPAALPLPITSTPPAEFYRSDGRPSCPCGIARSVGFQAGPSTLYHQHQTVRTLYILRLPRQEMIFALLVVQLETQNSPPPHSRSKPSASPECNFTCPKREETPIASTALPFKTLGQPRVQLYPPQK